MQLRGPTSIYGWKIPRILDGSLTLCRIGGRLVLRRPYRSPAQYWFWFPCHCVSRRRGGQRWSWYRRARCPGGRGAVCPGIRGPPGGSCGVAQPRYAVLAHISGTHPPWNPAIILRGSAARAGAPARSITGRGGRLSVTYTVKDHTPQRHIKTHPQTPPPENSLTFYNKIREPQLLWWASLPATTATFC